MDDALGLFEEANTLEKWRDIYGTVVLANLAFICAKKKNYIKAKQFLNDYSELYAMNDNHVE